MRYAIVINLNYENNPQEDLRDLFRSIHTHMSSAGFKKVERVFTIDLPAAAACVSARQAVGLGLKKHGLDGRPHHYIKEFYGFEHSKSVNLLAPPVEGIDVEELTHEMLDALINTDAIN